MGVMNATARDLLREKGTPAEELGFRLPFAMCMAFPC